MTIREINEEREYKELSPFAAKAADAVRDREEEECEIRTSFQRDRDRIIHSRAFRRLKDKTQVFLTFQDDHYRTRLTHTIEVSQIARTIAKALNLNCDLVEAIALGHDLGHTPFGHEGEGILNEKAACGFAHNEQSVRLVEVLEKDGKGLNLTKEVREGMQNHRTRCKPKTLEAQVVRLSDKLAYIHHDMDDAKAGGIITEEDVPADICALLGQTCTERLDALIKDIIYNSMDKPEIIQSPDYAEALYRLRAMMFERVYYGGPFKEENEKACRILRELYDFYYAGPEKMSADCVKMLEGGEAKDRVVCDYISGMTDRFAVRCFEEQFIPMARGIY